jgi:hypothetical protein
VSAVLSVLPEAERSKKCSSDPSLVPDSPLSQVSSTVLVVSSMLLRELNNRNSSSVLSLVLDFLLYQESLVASAPSSSLQDKKNNSGDSQLEVTSVDSVEDSDSTVSKKP